MPACSTDEVRDNHLEFQGMIAQAHKELQDIEKGRNQTEPSHQQPGPDTAAGDGGTTTQESYGQHSFNFTQEEEQLIPSGD